MYVRDHRRPMLHNAMGLEATAYDYEVFRITNEITQQVFPIALDIDLPAFRAGMTHLADIAQAYDDAKERGGLIGGLQRVWHGARAFVQFTRLYFLPVKAQQVHAETRLQPTW
jgi:magnesium-protoporphyrin IX monomethyl ester (oxidative) cyclase